MSRENVEKKCIGSKIVFCFADQEILRRAGRPTEWDTLISAGLRAAVQSEGSIPCTPPAPRTTAAHPHASVQRFVCCYSLLGMLCVGQKHTTGMLVGSAYHMPIITLGRQAQLLCCLPCSMLMYWPKLGDKAFQIAPPIFCFGPSSLNTCVFLDLGFLKADGKRCRMQPGKKAI